MKLKHTEDRVLAILRDMPDTEWTASTIGAHLWGKRSRAPQSFARPAGKLLRLLERQGKVEWYEHEDGILRYWRLTKPTPPVWKNKVWRKRWAPT